MEVGTMAAIAAIGVSVFWWLVMFGEHAISHSEGYREGYAAGYNNAVKLYGSQK